MRELSADHPHHHLLSPGRIGTLQLRNRILMCPMGDDQATDGGYVTPQQIAYFEARARGGAALLLVGSVGITAPEGLASPQQSAIGDASSLSKAGRDSRIQSIRTERRWRSSWSTTARMPSRTSLLGGR